MRPLSIILPLIALLASVPACSLSYRARRPMVDHMGMGMGTESLLMVGEKPMLDPPTAGALPMVDRTGMETETETKTVMQAAGLLMEAMVNQIPEFLMEAPPLTPARENRMPVFPTSAGTE